VITGGWPNLPGETILEKRRHASAHHDALRKALMWEPRGHADMYGCLLTEPVTADGDVGVLFLHNQGYSTMCGHGIIGLVTVGLECGILDVGSLDRDEAGRPIVRIDTPAGRVTAAAELSTGPDRVRVESVSFENVPSFVLAADLAVDVEGFGSVRCDIAFGGAYYVYVEAADVGLVLEPASYADIIDAGRRVKAAVAEQYRIVHPGEDQDLAFLYGTIFVAPAGGSAHSRNVCVFAAGEVDRSPTGTGVSGRAAIHAFRGELGIGEAMVIESLIGTCFRVTIKDRCAVGERPAVVPEVTGSAHLTGRHEFFLDPDDPLGTGFLLR
jgi:trans-L-3-hydroxyproline dehydratase